MNNGPQWLTAALLCVLLASCASSTMDSTPTVAELESYERVIRARYQAQYADLASERSSGKISAEEYAEGKRRLDGKVSKEVNDAAWNKHFLAESERKADGVPTPDAPVALYAGQAGAGGVGYFGNQGGGGSFYRPSSQNFGAVAGMGGSAGMGSMSSANQQIGNVQTIRNDAMSAGGTYLSQPAPGSIYDDNMRR